MDPNPALAITHYFHELPDPRLGCLCRHELFDIIVIAICAVISGQHTWTGIAWYGQDHYDWLKTFLRLPNGIPSHDTFRYVFTRLDPAAFQRCFTSWIEALSQATDLKQIAIDGKALRGSLIRFLFGRTGIKLADSEFVAYLYWKLKRPRRSAGLSLPEMVRSW
jgi:hypothetical protein